MHVCQGRVRIRKVAETPSPSPPIEQQSMDRRPWFGVHFIAFVRTLLPGAVGRQSPCRLTVEIISQGVELSMWNYT